MEENNKKIIDGKTKKNIIRALIIAVMSLLMATILIIFLLKNEKENYFITNNWHDVPDLPMSAKLYPVKKDGKWGYINTSGEFMIENMYDYAYYFYGEIAQVELGDDVSLIDKNGIVIENSKDDIYDDYYGVFIINGNLYYKDTKKKNSDDIYVYPFENDDYINDTGIFGFFNEKENITGIINREGEIIYKLNSLNKMDLVYDESSSNDYNNFPNRYCEIEVDNKSGIINCDTGKEIYPLSSEYDYDLFEYNFIDIYTSDGTYIRSEYIYQDKIMQTFTYSEGIYDLYSDDEENYIQIYFEDHEDEYILFNGTKIKEDEIIEGNWYKKANYLLGEKFEIISSAEDDDFYHFGIKKNGKLVLPIEYENFYFDLENENYVIGFKDDIYYLYDLNNTSTVVLESNKMGFVNSEFIYYYENDNKYLYNLKSGKKIILDMKQHELAVQNYIDKEQYILGYDNFIEIQSGKNRIIYNKNLEKIFEYTR